MVSTSRMRIIGVDEHFTTEVARAWHDIALEAADPSVQPGHRNAPRVLTRLKGRAQTRLPPLSHHHLRNKVTRPSRQADSLAL